MRVPVLFVSYARRDQLEFGTLKLVRRIAAAMTRLGASFDLFVDEQVRGGAEWEAEIEYALASSTLFLACVSPGYGLSPWCSRELTTFREKVERRRAKGDRIHWLCFEGGEPVAESLGLGPLQHLIDATDGGEGVSDAEVERAARRISELLDSLRPQDRAQTAPSRSLWARVSRSLRAHLGRWTGTPAPRADSGVRPTYQYHSALDSVRTQLGSTAGAEHLRVDVRVKLGYLLGYTAVLSDSQAFDSPAAIRIVASAARAWDTVARSRAVPIAPFLWVPFGRVHAHLVDHALSRLKTEGFDSSAWHPRSPDQHRVYGGPDAVDLRTIEQTDRWSEFLVAADFLTHFCSKTAAKPTGRTLSGSIELLGMRIVQAGLDGPVAGGVLTIAERPPTNRSLAYQAIDAYAESLGLPLAESLRDVIDVAYNRTIAESVLLAATPDPTERSFVLTDPTPDTSDAEVNTLARWVAEQRAEGEVQAFDQLLFGAGEGSHPEWDAGDIGWEEIFEHVSHDLWARHHANLVQARASGEPLRVADALRSFADWMRPHLGREHLRIDQSNHGGIALIANGAHATLGEVAEAPATGAVSLQTTRATP